MENTKESLEPTATTYWEQIGETLNNVFDPTIHHQQEPLPPPTPPAGAGSTSHRRSQSDVLTGGGAHKRNVSLQRLKNQMQKAWRWGGNNKDQSYAPSFNPEVLANQKRQWYQLHSKSALDPTRYKDPTSLFEHFVIAGLHHESDLRVVEDAFAARKKWELERVSEGPGFGAVQSKGPEFPILEPQILFKYPPGKRLAMRLKDLAAFCFPGGVKTRLPERTPSLSELSELVYGQEHLSRDDSAFVFSLKVGDNETLYGVCLHVTEIVQRPPGILRSSSPFSQPSGRFCRFLVSAPRCYCLLTRVPFFELHYEMLHSIIAQEHLNRITQFISEISLTSYVTSPLRQHDQLNENFGSLDKENGFDWMTYAIPVDNLVALSAAAAGLIPEDDVQTLSPKIWETHSPESVSASESSECSQSREVDKDCRKNARHLDDCASESSETRSDCLDRIYGGYENGQVSPEIGIFSLSKTCKLDRLGSFDTLFSPVRSTASEDEEDEFFSNFESDLGDELIMEWARENKNDLLQIVCGYHALPIAQRGSQLIFQPLQILQAIEYKRPSVSDLSFGEYFLASYEAAELAASEEACALSKWTIATICRVLSLESVLAMFAGVLLEKQIVVVCSNLGILSAIVLSIIPMIRPFQWQSLLLPILPWKMLDFLDAPVPFIVGIHDKPVELKMKTSNLVHVNVLKDQVKTCHLPTLPRHKELVSELRPIHAKLSSQSSVAKRHPVYKCNEVQAEAATQFLAVMRCYLESLCSDLRSYTITSVQANNDRVSLLLKDSFIDSFPSRDRPFIKLLVDTQQFALLSDCRLTTMESRRF